MSSKIKKVLSVIANIFVILVIMVAIGVTFLSISAKQNGNVPMPFGHSVFTIQTDSMEPTIKVGDLIIGDKVESKDDLKVGDIISFKTLTPDGKPFINTHRIVEITTVDDVTLFTTKGDNEEQNDQRKVTFGDIVTKYSGTRIAGLGAVITYLNTKVGFFVCIVLPVLLYTLWQVYKLILVIMNNQKVKLLEEASEGTSEEVKQQVIAEYLAKQKELEEQQKKDQKD